MKRAAHVSRMIKTLLLSLLLVAVAWAPVPAKDWRVEGADRVVAISDIHGAYGAMVETLQNVDSVSEGLRVRVSSWDVFTIDLNTGTATLRSQQQGKLNLLKQEYSRQALRRVARLRGWQFRQQQGQQKGVLRK